ncbi:MAG: beta-lactamase family protein [Candidatus Moduliflexus flocculans]|nr:beta-lactamase family protein [Candidatus Moduliflexus flocculans]
MAALHVPGVERRRHRRRGHRLGQGLRRVAEAGSPTPVTTATLFQAASISKSVAALAALRLVEQGRLALDEDVNVQARLLEGAGERVHTDGEGHPAPAAQPHGGPDRARLRRLSGRRPRAFGRPGARRREAGQQRRGPGRRRPRRAAGAIRAAASRSCSS